MKINKNEIFKPILDIIDFNFPSELEKDQVYHGKTIFFERVFFKTFSHICQECLTDSNNTLFASKLPKELYITKHVPNLKVNQVYWEEIVVSTGFDTPEGRNTWAKIVFEFTKNKFSISKNVELPQDIEMSKTQTIFTILFCYFYYYNREYTELSSQPSEFMLPQNNAITWALFEPGVISAFISPLRKIPVFNAFDERDLAYFFRLSGNPLQSLRWILKPVYREWYRPLLRSIAQLDIQKALSEPRFAWKTPLDRQLKKGLSIHTSNSTFLNLPNSLPKDMSTPEENKSMPLQEEENLEKLYYDKVLEVQKLRQQLLEKGEGIPTNSALEVFDDLLRFPGEFENLFTQILPYRSRTNMRKWRTVERTMLNLRSLFVTSGFTTFGEINETVVMETVAWPYAIDDRATISTSAFDDNQWQITRRGVRKNGVPVLPILVQPSHKDDEAKVF